jgi:hypothetical protein
MPPAPHFHEKIEEYPDPFFPGPVPGAVMIIIANPWRVYDPS